MFRANAERHFLPRTRSILAGWEGEDIAIRKRGPLAIFRDGGWQEIHRRAADEARDISIGGAFKNLPGGSDLRRTAFMHDNEPIAERHCLYLVMRDEKAGDTKPALQALDFRAHGNAELRIQIGQRFIEQE